MITKCICCENSEENNFINFNYSKNCSMNYPIEMEGAIIKYCKNCSFAFCSKHISSDRLELYYKKYYNGKSVKSDSHLENSIIRKYFYDRKSKEFKPSSKGISISRKYFQLIYNVLKRF